MAHRMFFLFSKRRQVKILGLKFSVSEKMLFVNKRMISLSATETLILYVLGTANGGWVNEAEIKEHFTEHSGDYWVRSRIKNTKETLKKKKIPLQIKTTVTFTQGKFVYFYKLNTKSNSFFNNFKNLFF